MVQAFRAHRYNRDRRNIKNAILPSIIGLMVGGVIGWGIANTPNTPKTLESGLPTVGVGGAPDTRSIVSNTTSDAVNLRVSLNSLLKEHGVLASRYMQRTLDADTTDADFSALNENGGKISDIVGNIWGDKAKTEFSNMWLNHINQYKDYTIALRNNDQNTQSKIRQNLQGLSSDMGSYFHDLDTGIPANIVGVYMSEHTKLTLDLIDAYKAKDDPKVLQLTKSSYDQAGQFADFLSLSIINAKSEKFR